MSQVARNLSDAAEGFLIGKRYLIHDRDPLFTAEFLEILQSAGVQAVKLPPSSPNLKTWTSYCTSSRFWNNESRLLGATAALPLDQLRVPERFI